MILGMAVNIQRFIAFAQIHQNPGSILQTSQISNMVIVVMGQDNRINIFQGDVGLQLSQDTGPAVKQYVLPLDLQQISGRGLPQTGIGPPPPDDG